MLQAALEDEVNAFLEAHASKTDHNDRNVPTTTLDTAMLPFPANDSACPGSGHRLWALEGGA
jgi:hypothetical protein